MRARSLPRLVPLLLAACAGPEPAPARELDPTTLERIERVERGLLPAVLIEGEPVSRLCVAITGRAHVDKQGRRIGTLEPGHIVGTALALTGVPSPVDATFSEAARYMSWPLSSLRAFIDKRPDLRVTLQGLVSRDLAGKLERLLA